ncbi:MAG: phosphonate ABC transporter ATP-binding protein, partial [Prochlorothrix sp.]
RGNEEYSNFICFLTKMVPVFALNQVSRSFQAQSALEQITLHIWPQERVGVIGSSGAGKSTLLSLLNGSLAPSQGEILILGQNLGVLRSRQRRSIQRRIGTIYQHHHLVGSLAVVHNVNGGRLGEWSLVKAAWSLLWPQGVDRVRSALEQVGLAEKLWQRTDRLSGGEQQRVALARVLVQDPVAIVADEPVSSLDPARSEDLMQLLCELATTQGKTLVISLHDVALAQTYCTRLVGLRQGRIHFDLPTEQVTAALIEDLYRY